MYLKSIVYIRKDSAYILIYIEMYIYYTWGVEKG